LLIGLALITAGVPAAAHEGRSARSPLPAIPIKAEALAPGAWVKYSVIYRRTGQAMVVRMALLEREGQGQWFETEVAVGGGKGFILKALLEGPLVAPTRLLQVVMQIPGHPPVLLSEQEAGGALPRFSSAGRGKARPVSRGKVRVTAGTFVASRYRVVRGGRVTHSWLSDAVKGWQLVKLEDPEVLVELVAYGEKARSRIRGRPMRAPAGSGPRTDH
jgi:hypothetical protein